MRFKRSLRLEPEEKQQLLDWGEDIFDSAELDLIWRPKEQHIILYDGTRPAAKCSLLRQEISVGEQTLSIAGVGGVVTSPQFQGRGLARRVLKEALAIAREEWLQDAAVLFCRNKLVEFYESQGWQVFTNPPIIQQPGGFIESPTPVMYHCLRLNRWPGGEVRLDSLPW